MVSNTVCVSFEFDKFADRPVQTITEKIVEIALYPILSFDQSDLEFTISEDDNTTINPNMQIYVKSQLFMAAEAELEETDYTAGIINFLHSLISQCNISINGVSITPSSDNYNYRAYVETILTNGSDAAESHLTKAYWYKDDGNMLTCDTTDTYTGTTKNGFIRR
jgi:hypothetical protein